MNRREPDKSASRERPTRGVRRGPHSIRQLWSDMWAGAGEANPRLRWRRWDRDLDFR